MRPPSTTNLRSALFVRSLRSASAGSTHRYPVPMRPPLHLPCSKSASSSDPSPVEVSRRRRRKSASSLHRGAAAIEVSSGRFASGSFARIPVCTGMTEFHSHVRQNAPAPSGNISPIFVARAPRCHGSGSHGPRDAEGVADTTSKRLEGVRPATVSRLASASQEIGEILPLGEGRDHGRYGFRLAGHRRIRVCGSKKCSLSQSA